MEKKKASLPASWDPRNVCTKDNREGTASSISAATVVFSGFTILLFWIERENFGTNSKGKDPNQRSYSKCFVFIFIFMLVLNLYGVV